jgi:hypothetical protein
MAKGKTKVKFVGGVWDGETFDDFDTRMMHDSIQVFSGVWAKKMPDGNIGLMRSERYGKDWIYYQNNRYQRNGKDDSDYFIYQFVEEIENHRCEAKTQKGTQCKNIAIDLDGKLLLCSTHKNS